MSSNEGNMAMGSTCYTGVEPCQLANETIGVQFADSLVGAVQIYRASLAEEGEEPRCRG